MARLGTRSIFLALVVVAVLGRAAVSGQRTAKTRTLTEQKMVDMMPGSSIQASRSANAAPTIQAVKDGIAAGRKVAGMYTRLDLRKNF
jgi:hypothetical protein